MTDTDEGECRECGHPGGGHNMGCRIHHRIALDEMARLRGIIDKAFANLDAALASPADETEIERLRACLAEAVSIAHGSGADFTWQALERLGVLQRIADGDHQ